MNVNNIVPYPRCMLKFKKCLLLLYTFLCNLHNKITVLAQYLTKYTKDAKQKISLIYSHTKNDINNYKNALFITIKRLVQKIINWYKNDKLLAFFYCTILYVLWKIALFGIISVKKMFNNNRSIATNKVVVRKAIGIQQISKTIDCYGIIDSDNNLIYQSEASGIIKEIYVRDKQRVKAGEIVGTLESKETENRFQSIKSMYESKEAQFIATEQLYKQGLESDITLKLARAARDAAKSDLILAKKAREGIIIQSPFDGIIDNIKKKAGSMVNVGEVLFSVQKENDLIAKCNTVDNDVTSITEGSEVELISSGASIGSGNVAIVARNKDPHSGARLVTIANIKSNTALTSGESVIIKLQLLNKTVVFEVSSEAIEVNELGGLCVKIYNPTTQKVEQKNINIFTEKNGMIYTTDLTEGDLIIERGHDLVKVGESNIKYNTIAN